MARYTLGDNPLAGDRLAILADVFGPSTRALVETWAPSHVDLAVDLGCGPGHTTRLLARTAEPARTVGLDASAAFIERARRETGDDDAEHSSAVEFVHHDATIVPFPAGPADLVLARYLLAHLPDPAGLVELWGTQLAGGGRLLLDEVERIDTSVEAFTVYLEVSGAMIADQGATLYVGADLAGFDRVPGLERLHSGLAFVAPPTATVARLFAMNLATWRHDPYIASHVDPAIVEGLDTELDALLRSDAEGDIVWSQRQVVYERPG